MSQTRKKVLIVDDDQEDLELIMEVLEADRFECRTTTSASDGLESARKWQPDIILLDLILPVMSGFGCLRELKKDPKLSKIPVVVLTTLRDRDVATASVDMGAVGYLSKDCMNQELISMVYAYAA